jgi:hypothetical protein
MEFACYLLVILWFILGAYAAYLDATLADLLEEPAINRKIKLKVFLGPGFLLTTFVISKFKKIN